MMSLFDVLRYQNINLGNAAELATLPEELIDLYWTAVGGVMVYPGSTPDKCSWLALWAKAGRHGVGLPCFEQVLKDYNDEPI